MDCLLKDNRALLYARKIAVHRLREDEFLQEEIARALDCSQAWFQNISPLSFQINTRGSTAMEVARIAAILATRLGE